MLSSALFSLSSTKRESKRSGGKWVEMKEEWESREAIEEIRAIADNKNLLVASVNPFAATHDDDDDDSDDNDSDDDGSDDSDDLDAAAAIIKATQRRRPNLVLASINPFNDNDGTDAETARLLAKKEWPATTCVSRRPERPGESDDAPPIYHLHIPKTGGTSFNNMLQEDARAQKITFCRLVAKNNGTSDYGPAPPAANTSRKSRGGVKPLNARTKRGWFDWHHTDCAFGLRSDAELARIRVVFGHAWWDLPRGMDARRPLKLVLLREPVARAASLYYFHRDIVLNRARRARQHSNRHAGGGRHGEFQADDPGGLKFGRWATFADAVAWSCGDARARAALLDAYPQSAANAAKGAPRSFADTTMVGHICGSAPLCRRPGPARLARAARNLLRTDVVGTTERGLDDFVRDVSRHVEWFTERRAPRIDPLTGRTLTAAQWRRRSRARAARRPAVGAREAACLRKLLAEDVALYKLAQAIARQRDECSFQSKTHNDDNDDDDDDDDAAAAASDDDNDDEDSSEEEKREKEEEEERNEGPEESEPTTTLRRRKKGRRRRKKRR